jgi:hypothetical protein
MATICHCSSRDQEPLYIVSVRMEQLGAYKYNKVGAGAEKNKRGGEAMRPQRRAEPEREEEVLVLLVVAILLVGTILMELLGLSIPWTT